MAKLIGPLQPYKPSSDKPFTAVRAAHLLNRAGFGGSEQRVLEPQAAGQRHAVAAGEVLLGDRSRSGVTIRSRDPRR